jgi:hypothetical protein
VIAAGDDGLDRFEIGEALQEVEVERDGILRRVRGIEDIAAEEQRVDFFGAEGFDEPVHEGRVLGEAVPLDEAGAEVPVSGVEDAHSAML